MIQLANNIWVFINVRVIQDREVFRLSIFLPALIYSLVCSIATAVNTSEHFRLVPRLLFSPLITWFFVADICFAYSIHLTRCGAVLWFRSVRPPVHLWFYWIVLKNLQPSFTNFHAIRPCRMAVDFDPSGWQDPPCTLTFHCTFLYHFYCVWLPNYQLLFYHYSFANF